MSIPYSADDIERVLGYRYRRRAENKRRGGDSAGIGYEYEVSVTLVLLMEAATETRCSAGTSFTNQPLGFADDLLIVRDKTHEFYQIKSELKAPQMSRRHLVVEDLTLQSELMGELGLHADVYLVVGDERIREAYLEAMDDAPFNIIVHSRDPLPQNAGTDERVTNAVHSLLGGSARPLPFVEPSLAYHVCRAFKSAWEACGRYGTVAKITDAAASSCKGLFGSLRLRLSRRHLTLLRGVAGARFTVLGRCLLWESTDTGRLSLMEFRDQQHFDAFMYALSEARRQLTLELVLYGKAQLDGR